MRSKDTVNTKKMPKEDEMRKLGYRRTNILFLIQRYLEENGYCKSVEALRAETHLSDDLELCDNIDIDSIYLEYASYYQMKFGKYPKIVRKKTPIKVELTTSKQNKLKQMKGAANSDESNEQLKRDSTELSDNNLQVTVTKISTKQGNVICMPEMDLFNRGDYCNDYDNGFNFTQEWQQFVQLVQATILDNNNIQLHWDDIIGNKHIIEIIKEAVLAPIQHPQIFKNGLKSWKSVLLHGPPGSGKTMLARALYCETRTHVTFFNVTSSIVVSKWRGESEKILRVLFTMAKRRAPSIIFFDEIEALTSRRDRPTDHESSKRFKSELLQLLDGIDEEINGVFIFATTNLPWDIDDAFLRRFEKKVLIELPTSQERAKFIKKSLSDSINLTHDKLHELVCLSEHFTGDELRLGCKEIVMQTIRCLTKGKNLAEIPILAAFQQLQPICIKLMAKHQEWQQNFSY